MMFATEQETDMQQMTTAYHLSITSPKMTMRKVEAHTPISPEVMSASRTDVAALTICLLTHPRCQA
jgi:hypothetical protein